MDGLVTGRMVYYVAYGTPGGEYPAGVERAAVVTEVNVSTPSGEESVVGLCILNPTGLFFTRRVKYDAAGAPGTWHWMFDGQDKRYVPGQTSAAALLRDASSTKEQPF